jgi:hypothetical protein
MDNTMTKSFFSYKTAAVCLVLLFMVIIALLLMYKGGEVGFADNMVPELIGFCLEGIFFAGLFPLFQHFRELSKRRQIASSLRGFLGVFLQEMNRGIQCLNFTPIEDPETLTISHEGIEMLADNVNSCTINETTVEALHTLSHNEISALESLLPVAAQLSAAHMICWHKILEQVKTLGKTRCKHNVHDITLQLLRDIKAFEQHEI